MKYLTSRWWTDMLQKHFWRTLGVFLLIFFTFSVVVIYQAERVYDKTLTMFDAFRIVLVFFLGEYGDTPKTEVGKILSLLLFVLGIVVVAAFIGRIASFFIEMRLEVKMPKGMERHIVVCNWHEQGDRIIKELHSPLAAPDTDVIVITQQTINEAELRISPAYERVYFIRSDPTMHDVLRRARAHHAKSVVILADPESSDPDAKTALISLAITKLEQQVEIKPHIIAEVMNHNKVQHLVDAGVDEWVCSSTYGLGIIAQSALYGKLSEVYQQLLTYSEDTNEIYLVEGDEVPESFLGKDFQEVAALLNKSRHDKNPAVLIGVKRNNEIILNPRTHEFQMFKPGDGLVVLSFDRPHLLHHDHEQLPEASGNQNM